MYGTLIFSRSKKRLHRPFTSDEHEAYEEQRN